MVIHLRARPAIGLYVSIVKDHLPLDNENIVVPALISLVRMPGRVLHLLMPNLNYKRSRARETKTVNLFKKDGDFATRTPGSKSPIDVIAFRPPTCGHCDCPDVFQHTHVQIKVSEHIKKGSIIQTEIEHPFPMPLEIWKFPVKVKKKK